MRILDSISHTRILIMIFVQLGHFSIFYNNEIMSFLTLYVNSHSGFVVEIWESESHFLNFKFLGFSGNMG